jgi:hypothetical protein
MFLSEEGIRRAAAPMKLNGHTMFLFQSVFSGKRVSHTPLFLIWLMIGLDDHM